MRKTRKIKKMKGSGKIGQGISGIVHYPSLRCKNNSKTPKGDYVSKKSKKTKAQEEFEKTELLRKLKIDNMIYPEHICEYNDNHDLLFSKFGGYSLVKYFDYLEDLAYSKSKNISDFDETYFDNVIKAMYELKESIKILNENDIYQGDISFDNILYNEDEKKAYLIDFERGGKKKNEYKEFQGLIDIFLDFKKRIDSKRD